MKKILIFTFTVLFFCLITGQNSVVYANAYPPEISAVSGIVIDATTGRILYEKNSNSQQLPASTTKIMTALLAIESGHEMNEMVKISERAAKTEGSSIYTQTGELISFEDLLYALMLRSGNDSAVALAEYISGSVENFAAKMNERAKELGAENTNFVTVNGLHDDNHYTTAADMALIAREAMKNEFFRKIVATQSWNASREVDRFNYFYNKNKVLYQYDGGNGIKIGYTTAAGRCLVASSKRNGIELICVVFNAPNWFNDSYRLMDYIYENFTAQTLIKKEEPIAAVSVDDGEKGHTWLVTDHDIVFPKKNDEEVKIEFMLSCEKSVKAPVNRGNKAGEIIIYYNGEEVGRDSVIFREDIEISSDEKTTWLNKMFRLFIDGFDY